MNHTIKTAALQDYDLSSHIGKTIETIPLDEDDIHALNTRGVLYTGNPIIKLVKIGPFHIRMRNISKDRTPIAFVHAESSNAQVLYLGIMVPEE